MLEDLPPPSSPPARPAPSWKGRTGYIEFIFPLSFSCWAWLMGRTGFSPLFFSFVGRLGGTFVSTFGFWKEYHIPPPPFWMFFPLFPFFLTSFFVLLMPQIPKTDEGLPLPFFFNDRAEAARVVFLFLPFSARADRIPPTSTYRMVTGTGTWPALLISSFFWYTGGRGKRLFLSFVPQLRELMALTPYPTATSLSSFSWFVPSA